MLPVSKRHTAFLSHTRPSDSVVTATHFRYHNPYLFDTQTLDIKDQLRIRRNVRRRAFLPVPKIAGDRDASFTAHTQSSNANVPTLDHISSTQLECERLAGFVRVEHFPAFEFADVPHFHAVAGLGLATGAEFSIIYCNALDVADAKGGLVGL